MRRTVERIQDVINAIDAGNSWPIPSGNGFVTIDREDDGLYTVEFIDPSRSHDPSDYEVDSLSPYKSLSLDRKQLEVFLRENTRY
jgi:hypothetical protein